MMKPNMENKAIQDLEGLMNKQTKVLDGLLSKAKDKLNKEQYSELQSFIKDAISGKEVDPTLLIQKLQAIANTD